MKIKFKTEIRFGMVKLSANKRSLEIAHQFKGDREFGFLLYSEGGEIDTYPTLEKALHAAKKYITQAVLNDELDSIS
jgi:hypothetical protein